MSIISVDIGGTQIRVAAFNRGSPHPLIVKKTPTHNSDGTVYDRLSRLIATIWSSAGKVEAISADAPGPLEPKTGIVLSTPNIKEWVNFPLRDKLEDQFHVPVFLDNDANLAALGEWRYGAGKGHHDVLYLTISTGIGGGVILGDHLLLGVRGLATELGHITVLPDGPLCSCGQKGHLEAISSGTGIVNYVVSQLATGRSSILTKDTLNTKEIADGARAGDVLANEAFTRAGYYLGKAVADFLHIFNPSIVIFGGGVTQSGDLFFTPMRETMYKSVMDPNYTKDLEIAFAKLGDDVGLIGALVQAEMILPN